MTGYDPNILRPPRAKKSLGQHFLRDRNLARKIVALLHPGPEDRILEIGPGPGILTDFLLEAAPASLILMEKDCYWAGVRRAAATPCVTVIEGDALRQDWSAYSAPCKIIGNLPYNIASPLMWDVFSQATGLTRAVFMIQKEVGLRIIAAPGNKAYGALSIWVQSFCRPGLEFFVPPQAFTPQPKIWSAVLSFVPLPFAARPACLTGLVYLLRVLFQQRRKQLGVILRHRRHDLAVLEQCGIDARLRPEDLAPEQYRVLANFFEST